MFLNKRTLHLIYLPILLSLFCAGCATVRTPIMIDSSFSSKSIKVVVLMPVIDRRADKKVVLDLEKDVRLPAKEVLERKGYRVLIADKLSENPKITAEAVAEMNTENLASLGVPSDGSKLFFLYIDEAAEVSFFGYSFRMKATGSLIDKTDKIELWRDKSEGFYRQAGMLMDILFSESYKARAIQYCFQSLFISLPDASS